MPPRLQQALAAFFSYAATMLLASTCWGAMRETHGATRPLHIWENSLIRSWISGQPGSGIGLADITLLIMLGYGLWRMAAAQDEEGLDDDRHVGGEDATADKKCSALPDSRLRARLRSAEPQPLRGASTLRGSAMFAAPTFLRGAWLCCQRVYQAFHDGDIGALQGLASAQMLRSLELRMRSDPAAVALPPRIMEASVVSIGVHGPWVEAVAAFTLHQHEPSGEPYRVFRQLWTFRRLKRPVNSCWILTAIQDTPIEAVVSA